jgi:hypothetical protein
MNPVDLEVMILPLAYGIEAHIVSAVHLNRDLMFAFMFRKSAKLL